MSYSEGPWSVEANAYGTIFVYGSKTYGTPSGFRYRELICGGDSYKTLTPDNAALIGAAPELLVALREATLALDGLAKGEGVFKPIEQTIVLAKAAIAKAEDTTHA